MADGTQLAQAFLNLTLNAVEAMPARRDADHFHPGRHPAAQQPQKPSHVLIEFRDTGQGMPEEQRRRAFLLLSTTKQKGTGLGLAIVGRVVETHRGKVRILSRND
jgi:two-component system, NtrC family, sensor histidine kinase HydH